MLLLFQLNKTAAEVKKMIDEVYGEVLVGSNAHHKWFSKLKNKFDLDDKSCSRRPQEFGNDDFTHH